LHDGIKGQSLKDPKQNLIRRELLDETRGNIYRLLFLTSGTIKWYLGTIDADLLQKLRILCSPDWVDVTRGTVSVSVAGKRFQNPKDPMFAHYIFPMFGGNRVEQGQLHHLEAVNRYERNLEEYPVTPILVSTNLNGDYTIIDGVHHCIAAYLRYHVRAPGSRFIPIIGYLGVCQKESFWHAF